MQITSSCTFFLALTLLIFYLYLLFACTFCRSIAMDESLANPSNRQVLGNSFMSGSMVEDIIRFSMAHQRVGTQDLYGTKEV
jgi:hypothetical protein